MRNCRGKKLDLMGEYSFPLELYRGEKKSLPGAPRQKPDDAAPVEPGVTGG